MKAILKAYFGLLFLGVTFMSGCNDEPQPKVLFVIVDGIPADVLENTATPVLDAISGETGYTRSYVGGAVGEASESPTISAVGYNHLLTGTWSNKHNVWGNDIVAPNYDYWDIFRIAKEHDASLQTAIFSTWTDNRTKLIGDGLDAAGGKNHGPDLSWVYLQYTDDVSHGYGDGPEFTAAVQMMDVMMGEIWSAVQHRQSSFNEDWLVIVTTDHGRDAETGSDHGGQTDRERTTWIVTNSQNLNERFAATPAIVDILPSIAAHMKLDMPADIREQLDGQSFID
jgi:predicted AlkP superfamily pyrophosphatase or phosphodiesterase